MGDMELAAVSSLIQVCGSLMLALMVAGGGLSAEEAFARSRVDEEFQAARWGVDTEAAKRAQALANDAAAAGRFLRLL
jgi:chaperone required for assembly of F1-ATPase